jgi:prolyl 4-hydroxylase
VKPVKGLRLDSSVSEVTDNLYQLHSLGQAVLFYNLLEDGNGDDLALHAAMPVKEGEKWLANFWVWDPHFH